MNHSHRQHVEDAIRHLKAAPIDGGLGFAVQLRCQQVARLEPVTWRDAECADSVQLLAQWREAAADAFPAIFPVTIDGTHRWLIKQLLEVPDRLLFWIVTEEGQKIGHVGLFRFDAAAQQIEIDNVIRGVANVLPGIIEAAVAALLDWTFAHLEMRDVYLRVFSDNGRAIRLYQRCGFQETMRMPLKRVQENDVVRWLEVDGSYRGPVSRYFVTMRLPRAAWISRTRDSAQITTSSAMHAA
jgi:RimJ/RimL family protein N-acetyltransferase